MKQLWIIVACMAPLLGLQAQTPENIWTGSHYTLSIGGAMDYHGGMSVDWMRDHTVEARHLDVPISDREFLPYYTVSGGVFGFENSYQYEPTRSSGQRWKRELRLGLRLIVDREAMVNYYQYEHTENTTYSESLVFCLLDNEVGVEVAHLWRVDGRHFSAYGGLGANASATYNPLMLKIRHSHSFSQDPETNQITIENGDYDTETFEAKSSVFARVMAPIGVAWHPIKRLSVGLEYRPGFGVEQVIDGKSYIIPYSQVVNFKLGYFLRGGFRV